MWNCFFTKAHQISVYQSFGAHCPFEYEDKSLKGEEYCTVTDRWSSSLKPEAFELDCFCSGQLCNSKEFLLAKYAEMEQSKLEKHNYRIILEL